MEMFKSHKVHYRGGCNVLVVCHIPSLFPLSLQGKFLIVMVSTGEMYSQPLIPACSAADGPVYFTIDLPVTHSSIEVAEGQTCGGGASVYYSHCLQLLFFSYNNGGLPLVWWALVGGGYL